jgi:hypothetical protein
VTQQQATILHTQLQSALLEWLKVCITGVLPTSSAHADEHERALDHDQSNGI